MSSKKEKTNNLKQTIHKRKDYCVDDNFKQSDKGKKHKKASESVERKNRRKKSVFSKTLYKLTSGLVYISETDARIIPFFGVAASSVTGENLLEQIDLDKKTHFEITDFEDFFRHPSKVQDWFDADRIAQAKQYLALKEFLKKNLRDIRVFKVGKLNLDIYVVGLDSKNNLTGIKTNAVET